MTADHAARHQASVHEKSEAFDDAATRGDWKAAKALWLKLLFAMDVAVGESRAGRIEADALATELLTYRPTRHEKPPAPPLNGYVYVFTAKAPWVCAAVELRTILRIVPLSGLPYFQDHYVPEKKTLCGKAATFPVMERFTSGGWPRLHELCPDCTAKLVQLGFATGA